MSTWVSLLRLTFSSGFNWGSLNWVSPNSQETLPCDAAASQKLAVGQAVKTLYPWPFQNGALGSAPWSAEPRNPPR